MTERFQDFDLYAETDRDIQFSYPEGTNIGGWSFEWKAGSVVKTSAGGQISITPPLKAVVHIEEGDFPETLLTDGRTSIELRHQLKGTDADADPSPDIDAEGMITLRSNIHA